MNTKKRMSLLFQLLFAVILLSSCTLFGWTSSEAKLQSIKFDRNKLSLGVGGADYLALIIDGEALDKSVNYTYDDSIIAVDGDENGATVSAKSFGTTVLQAKIENKTAACTITVSGVAAELENALYITSSTPFVEIESGLTRRLLVSLSKSVAADMSSFKWEIDNSSICSIEATGQNAIINAKDEGVCRLRVTHPLASYPFDFLIFVKPETKKTTYITTAQNIVTLRKDGQEQRINVSLVNGDSSVQNNFTWELLNNDESDPQTIELTANGNNAVLKPQKAGTAIINVTHPDAVYPLIVYVRTVAIVDNVYIDTDISKVTIYGDEHAILKATLKGTNNVNNDDFHFKVEDEDICTLEQFQNDVVLKGVYNGITKLIITHPSAKYSKEVMVFVENSTLGAIHKGAYITTSQNYIRTKVGADETALYVTLIGGTDGDESDFDWEIKEDQSDIISMETVNGSINIRSIFDMRVDGVAYITPKKEGTAVISIHHPKILTPTDVLIKVYSENTMLDAPLNIKAQSTIGIVKGNTASLKVNLTGNVNTNDENKLVFVSENEQIATLSGAGDERLIKAWEVGQTYINISHENAEFPKKVLCYVAETEEELESMQLLYSEKMYYNVIAGESIQIYLSTKNIDYDMLDNIVWSSNNTGVATVDAKEDKTTGIITGISTGTATISAFIQGIPAVKFNITVYPPGTNLNVLPPAKYLTTSQNVVQYSTLNTDKTVSVKAINISPSEYMKTVWSVDDPSIVSVVPNGIEATITSLKEGQAKITVSHPESENLLVITIRIGSEYIIVNSSTPYISTNKDIVQLINEQQGVELKAEIKNKASNSLFNWSIDNEAIASISPVGDKCYIVPKAAGQAQITISHADATYNKNVLVIVNNSRGELDGFAYLTTGQNTIHMGVDKTQTVSVDLKGISDAVSPESYHWTVDRPDIMQLLANGKNAVITSFNEGIVRLTAYQEDCYYPLEIICIISTSSFDSSLNPYITSSSNIVTLKKNGASKELSVELVGGVETDKNDFEWSVDNGQYITIVPNRHTAMIKGAAVGNCKITIFHPKALYSHSIVVIVEDAPVAGSLYINASTNIISIKPGDSDQTIRATLMGGTVEDKYGFTWSMDNYNVATLTYSADTAILTPLQEGTATITISHPKAIDDITVAVRITEYSQFAFGQNSITMNEGSTQFVNMKVPSIENDYNGRVIYSTDNSKIVTITGTNKVAQLTAVGEGTATVTAQSPSGAKSDMMVYVKKVAAATSPYISTNTNVVLLLTTDNQRSLSAQLVGGDVTPQDQNNLLWSITDKTVAQLIGSSGSSVYIKPIKAGETTVKVTHEKTNSILTILINVSSPDQQLSLNATYMAATVGAGAKDLKATIKNGSDSDHRNITWSSSKSDIASIAGSGRQVGIIPMKAGTTIITASFGTMTATCEVVVSAQTVFNFMGRNSIIIEPGETQTFTYDVYPHDSYINWMTANQDVFAYEINKNTSTVSVTALKAGTGLLTASANSIMQSMTITSSWNYSFKLDKKIFAGMPVGSYTTDYTVHPADADIEFTINSPSIIEKVSVDKKNKKITITPKKEGKGNISVKAVNPRANNEPAGQEVINTDFAYNEYDFNIALSKSDGRFSKYTEAGGIVIGDGEEATFDIAISNRNHDGRITAIQFSKTTSTFGFNLPSTTYESFNLRSYNDYIEKEYKISSALQPQLYTVRTEVKGEEVRQTGPGWSTFYYYTDIIYSEPQTVALSKLVWHESNNIRGLRNTDVSTSALIYPYNSSMGKLGKPWNDYYQSVDYIGNNHNGYRRDEPVIKCTERNKWINYIESNGTEHSGAWYTHVPNSAETNKRYSISDFQKIAYYYDPVLNKPTQFVSATLVNTLDTTLRKSEKMGYITVIYMTKNGDPKSKKINVTYEERACSKN